MSSILFGLRKYAINGVGPASGGWCGKWGFHKKKKKNGDLSFEWLSAARSEATSQLVSWKRDATEINSGAKRNMI